MTPDGRQRERFCGGCACRSASPQFCVGVDIGLVSRLMDRVRDPETNEHFVASILAWLGTAAANIIEAVAFW